MSESFGAGSLHVDDFALATRSTPLARIVREEIEAAGGRISFARYMSLALGHPEYGYYARADLRWGREGDFETSPEVHPVFGYLWARQVVECWERLGSPGRFDLIEPGAGSGAFAVSLLTWLRERAPACFAAARPQLLDGHRRRLEEQRAALVAAGFEAEHALLDDWLARSDRATGVVISNELFDALPVHLVRRTEGELRESYVGVDAAEALRLEAGEPSTPGLAERFATLGLQPGEDCNAEVSLEGPALMGAIARRIERGYILTIDYGYEATDLYAPWRRGGTLLAFRGHSPQPDLLSMPGLTDLTAHVDFTSLAAAASREGFETGPLTTQARALVALGLADAVDSARGRMTEDFAGFAACELLARPSVEMHECGTGEEAMWSVHDFQPDWIIMDVHLPGMNGFEATEAIRKELPSVRVVIICAEDRDYLRTQAQAVGAELFLSKHHLAKLPGMLWGEPPQPPAA